MRDLFYNPVDISAGFLLDDRDVVGAEVYAVMLGVRLEKPLPLLDEHPAGLALNGNAVVAAGHMDPFAQVFLEEIHEALGAEHPGAPPQPLDDLVGRDLDGAGLAEENGSLFRQS